MPAASAKGRFASHLVFCGSSGASRFATQIAAPAANSAFWLRGGYIFRILWPFALLRFLFRITKGELFMIEPKDHPRWKELLTGQIQHQFQLASAAMIVSRCQRQVARDSSQQAYEKNLDEMYAFFTKFEHVVSDDIKAIFS